MSSYDLGRDGFYVSDTYLELPENAIVWEIFSSDPAAANRLLEERYGGAVKARVIGPSPTLRKPVKCRHYELVDPTTVRLWYPRVPVSEVGAVQVKESERRVEVSVFVDEYQGAAVLEVGNAMTEITLAAPLDEREVFDAVGARALPRYYGGASGSTVGRT